jgi:hypothetical protein
MRTSHDNSNLKDQLIVPSCACVRNSAFPVFALVCRRHCPGRNYPFAVGFSETTDRRVGGRQVQVECSKGKSTAWSLQRKRTVWDSFRHISIQCHPSTLAMREPASDRAWQFTTGAPADPSRVSYLSRIVESEGGCHVLVEGASWGCRSTLNK